MKRGSPRVRQSQRWDAWRARTRCHSGDDADELIVHVDLQLRAVVVDVAVRFAADLREADPAEHQQHEEEFLEVHDVSPFWLCRRTSRLNYARVEPLDA